MRYEIRWSNGFYKIFDTVEYRDVPTPRRLGSRREAEEWLRGAKLQGGR